MTDTNKTPLDQPVTDSATEPAATPVVEPTPTTDAPAQAAPVTEPAAEAATASEPTAEATTETIAEAPEQATPEVAALPTFADLRPGVTVRVHQKIRETNTKGEEKERIQIYEGIIIARKHGHEAGATITVRKISGGIGVEKIFPLNSPNVIKIEPIKQAAVRRSKLYFLRTWKKRLQEVILKK